MKNIFLTLILAVVLFTTGCMRRQSEFRHRGTSERVVNFITKELELDDAQRAKFESIVSTLQNKFDNLETLKKDLESEMVSQISARVAFGYSFCNVSNMSKSEDLNSSESPFFNFFGHLQLDPLHLGHFFLPSSSSWAKASPPVRS